MLFSFIFTSILCCTLLWLYFSHLLVLFVQLWECVEATSGHLHQLLLVTTCTTPQSLHFHLITYCTACQFTRLVNHISWYTCHWFQITCIYLSWLAFSDELIFLIVNLICFTNHNSLSLSLLEFTCLLL